MQNLIKGKSGYHGMNGGGGKGVDGATAGGYLDVASGESQDDGAVSVAEGRLRKDTVFTKPAATTVAGSSVRADNGGGSGSGPQQLCGGEGAEKIETTQRKKGGISRDARKPSVYLGFDAEGDEETRL